MTSSLTIQSHDAASDVIDQLQRLLKRQGGNPELIMNLVWWIIQDISSSYELAMDGMGLGSDITGDVNNTVGDYISTHYGD